MSLKNPRQPKHAGTQGMIIWRFFLIPDQSHDIPISPDEYPFTKDLPEPVLKPLDFPNILYPNTVNANPEILKFYVESIVPKITKRTTERVAAEKRAKGLVKDLDDDGNHGSAATLDVEILQAISKRVHYGNVPLPRKQWTGLTIFRDREIRGRV